MEIITSNIPIYSLLIAIIFGAYRIYSQNKAFQQTLRDREEKEKEKIIEMDKLIVSCVTRIGYLEKSFDKINIQVLGIEKALSSIKDSVTGLTKTINDSFIAILSKNNE